MKRNKQYGFTLIELLVVVSLIIIVVGVAGDIVVSLIRSYNKTQITTEVEQNANFTMTKIEKELRNAYEITNIQANSITFRREKLAGGFEEITYSVEDAGNLPDGNSGTYYIARAVDGATSVPVTNYTYPAGVTVTPGGTSFQDISALTGPKVIKITLDMHQIGNALVQFSQSTVLENTVIVRGTY